MERFGKLAIDCGVRFEIELVTGSDNKLPKHITAIKQCSYFVSSDTCTGMKCKSNQLCKVLKRKGDL